MSSITSSVPSLPHGSSSSLSLPPPAPNKLTASWWYCNSLKSFLLRWNPGPNCAGLYTDPVFSLQLVEVPYGTLTIHRAGGKYRVRRSSLIGLGCVYDISYSYFNNCMTKLFCEWKNTNLLGLLVIKASHNFLEEWRLVSTEQVGS